MPQRDPRKKRVEVGLQKINCLCTRWFKDCPWALRNSSSRSISIPCFLFGRTFFQDHQKHGKHFTFGMIQVWDSLGACSDRGSFTYVENLCVQIIVRKHRFWPIIRVEKAYFLPLFSLLLDKLASYKKILLVDLCC